MKPIKRLQLTLELCPLRVTWDNKICKSHHVWFYGSHLNDLLGWSMVEWDNHDRFTEHPLPISKNMTGPKMKI